VSAQEVSENRRKPLSKRLRFEVFKRDGFVCQYCGAHPPHAILECDHIVPVASGGENDFDNLITACFSCNRGKGAVGLDDIPQSLERRGEIVAEREAQIAGYEAIMREKRIRLEDNATEVLGVFANAYPWMKTFPEVDFLSIKRFVDHLGLHTVLGATQRAIEKRPDNNRSAFKYLCGICWAKIREGEHQ
jgi:DNA-directed RNA polymerase subunit RPC12/RpoP